MTEQVQEPSCKALLDEPQMNRVAAGLAHSLAPPLVIFLEGDLGAGKTTFARALIQGAGYPGSVKSPTYGIMEHYQTDELEFVHLDLYRIADVGELQFLGLVDLLGGQSVLLVEWSAHGLGFLPAPDVVLRFDYHADQRKVEFIAHSDSGTKLMESFQNLVT